MSMLIAQSMSERSSGRSGQASITVLDECWAHSRFTRVGGLRRSVVPHGTQSAAPSVWGISQTLEDFVGTKQKPKEHGAGILRNTSVKVIGQQPGDVSPLIDHLGLNEVALNEIKRFSAPRKGRSAEILLVLGEKSETTRKRCGSCRPEWITGWRQRIRGSGRIVPGISRKTPGGH